MRPAEVKEAQQALYGAGEYSGLSRVLEPAADTLVDATGVSAGDAVLDVAAGDGNVALAAARRGAGVVATDLSPVQVRRGAERSAAAGLAIAWEVADAERLPFGDRRFDRVLSAFGVVVAPDPEAAVGELFRVCRPGGLVGLTVWPRGSYMATLSSALRHALGPGVPLPDPELGWDDEAVVRARLAPHADDLRLERHCLRWDPAVRGSAGARDCSASYFMEQVPADRLRRLGEVRREVEARFARPDGHLDAEYLVAVATRRSPEGV